jgi:hypothetical protein
MVSLPDSQSSPESLSRGDVNSKQRFTGSILSRMNKCRELRDIRRDLSIFLIANCNPHRLKKTIGEKPSLRTFKSIQRQSECKRLESNAVKLNLFLYRWSVTEIRNTE